MAPSPEGPLVTFRGSGACVDKGGPGEMVGVYVRMGPLRGRYGGPHLARWCQSEGNEQRCLSGVERAGDRHLESRRHGGPPPFPRYKPRFTRPLGHRSKVPPSKGNKLLLLPGR
eukprot:scaffold926_cov408-Prasinococcus_capsulatus_cf.AAC.42